MGELSDIQMLEIRGLEVGRKQEALPRERVATWAEAQRYNASATKQ